MLTTDRSTAAELCRTALVRHAMQLLASDRDLARCDCDTVHDLRVASRRLRADLRLFRELIRSRDLRGLGRQLRSLTRLLGAPRQAAVSRMILDQVAPELPPESWPGLRRCEIMLDLRIERLSLAASARLDARRLRRLRRRILAAASATRAGTATREASRSWLLPRLRHEAAAWRAMVPGDPATLEAWHRFRIQTKRFRYALEAGQHADPVGLAGLIAALRDLQLGLGRQHDLVMLAADLDAAASSLARLDDAAGSRSARELAATVRLRAQEIDAWPATRAAETALASALL